MYTYLRKHIRQVPTVSAATCQLFRTAFALHETYAYRYEQGDCGE